MMLSECDFFFMKTTLHVLKRSRSICYVWGNKENFRIIKHHENKKHRERVKWNIQKASETVIGSGASNEFICNGRNK